MTRASWLFIRWLVLVSMVLVKRESPVRKRPGSFAFAESKSMHRQKPCWLGILFPADNLPGGAVQFGAIGTMRHAEDA